MFPGLPLFRAATVRAIERDAAASGVDAAQLMARAGEAAAAECRRRWPLAVQLGVLCGTGNNGGDGYVAAERLKRAGLEVHVVAVGEPRTPESRAACEAWRATGGATIDMALPWPAVDVWIDALFGTGLSRPPEGDAATAIARLAEARAAGAGILALDVPSGIDADRGSASGGAVIADATLCFIGLKRGLCTGPALDHAGELRVDALELDALVARVPPDARWVDASALATALPPRPRDTHKGRQGRVLAVGGSARMEGALVLCAEAAARAGAGAVEALGAPLAIAALRSRRPEVMGDVASVPHLQDALARAQVVVIGPGLGEGVWAADAMAMVRRSGRPVVFDADALHRLRDPAERLGDAVLTPPPGAAGALLGLASGEVQADRFAALEALVARWGAVVILKGAGTLVGAPGATPVVVSGGNPGMATAGMGDVLAGLVAGLRAQGLSAFDAAWVGAVAHAEAGDRASVEGQRGLLAGDVLACLRPVLNP
ncbi:MAG: NAD(P)H-hydrate dehydratase [Lysobacteraceae bacterium]